MVTEPSAMQNSPPPPIGHVFFSGLSEPCSVDSVVEVVVNTQSGGGTAPGEVQVYATSPIGLKRHCEVVRRDNSFCATFTPDRIGKWLIGILYEGEHIHGSPFPCQVYDPAMVHVYGLDVGLVGQELKFTVDASRAGQGEVNVSVSVNGQQLAHTVREEPQGSGIHRVRFTPQGPGKYKIHVNFNKQDVKGSPFLMDIADSNAVSVYGEQLQLAAVDRLANFFVHAIGVESRHISCRITGPSGKKKQARLIPLDEATYKAEWKPIETGEHQIEVFIFERPVPESPFCCQVGDPDLVTVRRMPQQIEAPNLGTAHTFEIDATAAGSGNLEIVINGGRVACRVHETTPRHFLAEFTPVQEVRHTVEMRFNGEHVRNSPWLIPFVSTGGRLTSPSGLDGRKREEEQMRYNDKEDIITELIGTGLSRAAVGQPAHFDIRSNSRLRANNVQVRIMDLENGRPLDVQLSERGPGTVHCQYTAQRVTDYEVLVHINGRRVDTEQLVVSAFDARKVRVRLKGAGDDYRVGKPAQFIGRNIFHNFFRQEERLLQI